MLYYYLFTHTYTGGLIGSAEGCFLSPVPNSTTPMLVRALGLIAKRSMLFGEQIYVVDGVQLEPKGCVQMNLYGTMDEN